MLVIVVAIQNTWQLWILSAVDIIAFDWRHSANAKLHRILRYILNMTVTMYGLAGLPIDGQPQSIAACARGFARRIAIDCYTRPFNAIGNPIDKRAFTSFVRQNFFAQKLRSQFAQP